MEYLFRAFSIRFDLFQNYKEFNKPENSPLLFYLLYESTWYLLANLKQAQSLFDTSTLPLYQLCIQWNLENAEALKRNQFSQLNVRDPHETHYRYQ